MTVPVLSVENLRLSFGSAGDWTPILHGVSFEIAPKSTLAIVGESGSGKSVTALSVMRLLPGNSRVEGDIRLNGRPLLDLPESRMRDVRGNEIAMIFQEPMTSLNPTMPAGMQISEVLTCHRAMNSREAKQESIRLLDRVRIPSARSRYNDYPHLLSGGMRQRVMIAMALACRPKLLIADEPTTALDVTVQAQILDLLRDLQEEDDLSILFITHDMGVVAEIADRTMVMLRGNMVEQGSTATIFGQPEHPYTRALIAAVPSVGSMNENRSPTRFPTVDAQTGLFVGSVDRPETVVEDKTILQVKNLSKRFDIRKGLLHRLTGRVHAIEDISFSIRPGETLALVGESGCGKSTTGRCIIGLSKPSGGSIEVNGRNVLEESDASRHELRHRMQMVFQDPYASLNPRMRIGESIAEPMIVHRQENRQTARMRVSELLENVGLTPDMRDRFPHEFSGGQRQRICIARALSTSPELIVADEAVSALDVSVKAQVVNLMMDLQEKMKLAFLFISHDMAVVERISHRVAVMYLGEIVEIGGRASIFTNPQHPYTKRLLSAVPVADPSRRTFRARLPDAELRSPVRAIDYTAPTRRYEQVGPNHHVQRWDPD